MRMTTALFAAFLLIPALAPSAELSPATLRAAAQKGLALLEKTSPTFIKKGGCNSCHNQMLPAAAQAFSAGAASPPAKSSPNCRQRFRNHHGAHHRVLRQRRQLAGL
jgi:hypothetical protein